MTKGIDFTGITIVFFCHDGQGNFVMLKRSENNRDENGTWGPGGGGLRFGETIEETLKREVKEEYGADVVTHEHLGFREVHREHNGVKTHWIAFDFKVLVDPTQVYIGEPEVHSELGWFNINDEMPAPMHSQWDTFYNKYTEQLKSF